MIYGPETLDQMTDKLMDLMLEVINGRQSKAEALGFFETAMARLCNYI